MKAPITSLLLILVLWMSCCSSDEKTVLQNENAEQEEMQETTDGVAIVTEVSVAGQENRYTFDVTISSTDLGCEQYADWWEVIDLDGNLLYRRILAHSHVDEQPFKRSGGEVAIDANTEVYIRAHMNTTGYGEKVFNGSVADGFASVNLSPEFAEELAESEPLPSGCAF